MPKANNWGGRHRQDLRIPQLGLRGERERKRSSAKLRGMDERSVLAWEVYRAEKHDPAMAQLVSPLCPEQPR